MILTKQIRTEDELKEEIKKGQVFFKANKPVELKDVA